MFKSTTIYTNAIPPKKGVIPTFSEKNSTKGFQLLAKTPNNSDEVGQLFSANDLLDPKLISLLDGSYHRMVVSPGCIFSMWDTHFNIDCVASSPVKNHIGIEFVLEGGCERLYGKKILKNLNKPTLYFTKFSENEIQQRLFKKGDKLKAITIWIETDTLCHEFGLDLSKLPERVLHQIEGTDTHVESLPFSLTMKTIVEDILNFRFEGVTRAKYIHCKIQELICHLIDSLYQSEQALVEESSLTQSKVSALAKVIAKLNDEYKSPPAIEDLAQFAGLSRTNLCNSFKAACGMTISEYVRTRRLEMGNALLANGKLSILQVAIEVGYQDQSSFTRAYRNHFGHPPKEDLPKG